MKYLLSIWVDESAELPAEEREAMLAATQDWLAEMDGRGVIRHGGALASAAESATVAVRDGQVLVSDGPFAETKEQIGGFEVIECESRDVAVEVAARHPAASISTIEVRSFWMEAPWEG